MSLKLENVTGGYTQVPVINNITFEVNPGELTGLIGLNGAGKSTTIKHIIGLMMPYSGEISIDGLTLRADTERYRRSFSFIPETPVLYEELTLREHLEITAMAYNIPAAEAMEKAMRYIKEFRLEDKLDWFPAYFSKGMKQKVMIVCSFMVDAPVYVIDEPFLGLDPLGIHSFLEMVKEKKKQGAAILMSTHVLASAEKECDNFILLHHGEVKVTGTMADLQKEMNMPGASLDELYISLTKEALPS
ncbi:abc transporter [Trichococcus palustris]|jgi:ABC-2 type transport system ATP-binding protein|uniref:Abc transporter n=1 Tax=Trichococcus palustris TaxID=140314 RepID=A0A143YK10_9LACT|nr:ABC transporter ATP-binding protein [Trichococcus palustris]CZQ91844.1 abc transporter [Trichococcus palustris]SFL04365.1 ABC-2 type transport system ATP-binding protein [Trichococcus palustris]